MQDLLGAQRFDNSNKMVLEVRDTLKQRAVNVSLRMFVNYKVCVCCSQRIKTTVRVAVLVGVACIPTKVVVCFQVIIWSTEPAGCGVLVLNVVL